MTRAVNKKCAVLQHNDSRNPRDQESTERSLPSIPQSAEDGRDAETDQDTPLELNPFESLADLIEEAAKFVSVATRADPTALKILMTVQARKLSDSVAAVLEWDRQETREITNEVLNAVFGSPSS